ncbi:chlorohydrolase [Nitrospira sp.]|nr:chlorohydrolase [Nitrospira sp.]
MILRAAWVAPGDAPPIRDGFVRIREDRIAEVGVFGKEIGAGAEDSVRDLGAVALTPGLINPHTHLELGCYAGKLPRGPLWPWLAELIRVRRQGPQIERETAAAAEFAWRSLRAGVTCVGDISRRNVGWRALKAVPIRKVCFVELLTLADQPPRTLAELRAALDEVLEDALLTAGVSPHAPYTVPASDARDAIMLAKSRGKPWTIHLAETSEEIAFLHGDASGLPPGLTQAQGASGMAPARDGVTAYLRGLRAEERLGSGYLAHCNYLTDEEVEQIAVAGCAVVYCPRAHAFYGHADHPIQRLRAAGVTVAVGSDSPACDNADLSPWRELQRLCAVHPTLAAEDATLLRLVTADAAVALGMADRIGAIRPGMLADLAAFPLPAPADRPIQALIRAAPSATRMWVGGREVAL